MKTLICKRPGEFGYEERAIPIPGPGELLLRMKMLGICGTDYHAFDGTQPFFEYPRILGHEISAEVAEAPEGSRFKVGDLVTVSPYFSCGKCIACRRGKTNCCTDINVFGVHSDGAMQEYISVPSSAVVPGNGLSAEELALIEPLAIAAHGVGLAQITKNDNVLILGAGPIGLGVISMAGTKGAKIIVSDVNENRLGFCKDKLGVAHLINPLKTDALAEIGKITGGDMATVIIDCTGNLEAINSAFRLLAHGGKFILIGLQKGIIEILHPEFHKRETMLMSSRNALPEDFDEVISSIKEGLIKPLELISHRVPFAGVKESFAGLSHTDQSLIKALVIFG
ncbi:zinc-binding alcohol dehydrogenase family protein [Pedobacter caeni]|uniref:2-desacetyl-2-hydroxyethyl bacteriochlorophyllide A dehydrogenase n=1 Tax=Pedobacter caeni TaxID=288992 RepID=A0A1M5A187_9SPHI|nr:zinc-binding alcohol dehydrogenase family protein [Pedobacter caeni]SHF24069.1 2-desacetyl-2-hydroxyethyl bacteriochlorophyllide A dehydrogenase [Pedobacter caeni]